MRPLIFMVTTEAYLHNGDVLADGIVTLDGHEIFRTQIDDPHEAEEETICAFAWALRNKL